MSLRPNVPTNYNLPLSVHLRMDQSIGAASLEYHNACGQPVALPIHDALEAQLKKRMGQVFERVSVASGASTEAIDGVVDVALGFRQLDMFVPRKSNKSYPATVALGLDFSYIDQQGTVLHSKKLQSVITGEVEARADTCDISGLDKVAQEAIATVVEGVAQQLGTATKIREQAQFRKTSRGAAVPPVSVQPARPEAAASSSAPMVPAPTVPLRDGSAPSSPAVPSGAPQLSFRTIIRDQNQNHVLEQHESFSVEVEVTNEGPAVAEEVAVDLSGHVAIVGGVKTPVSLGALQPGEVRRVAVEGKVGTVSDVEQAELICTLRAAPNVVLPSPKKFFVAIRPDATEVLSVDVDQLPHRNGRAAQPHAVGIAIGVGAFRDSSMPPAIFAAHDAEVMGGYFKAVLGIPPQKVKVMRDAEGLKDDWIEVFEQWLPKQGGLQTTAYIYVSGRAVVDHETGAVSMLPYDGTLSGSTRAYSLARLQRALAKAPVKHAVVMLELSLEPTSGSAPGRITPPRWASEDVGGEQDRVMVMVGNAAVQEARAYQPGQHGLFTYFLLKGMGGAADLDKNGTVLTGELCAYVQGQVTGIGRSTVGDTQQPLCLPESGRASPLRQLRLGQSR